MLYYVNGHWLPENQAVLPVTDRGFMYGDGVFETIAVVGGQLFRKHDHWQRLNRGLQQLAIEPPFSEQQFYALLFEGLQCNRLNHASLRLSVSRGVGPRGLSVGGCRDPSVVLLCFDRNDIPEQKLAYGTKLITVDIRRTPAECIAAGVKTANFINNIMAVSAARQTGADDALMLTTRGHIAECSMSNIFFVIDNTLLTPSLSSGIVAGVTRLAVIELAQQQGMTVTQAELDVNNMYAAEEMFCTNTGVFIMPVRQWDDIVFPMPARRCLKLRHALLDQLTRPDE